MITPDQCLAKFGPPDQAFEAKWMTTWTVPAPVRTLIKALPTRIYCNKLMIGPLTKAFDNIITRCLEQELKTWDGCFNVRKMRGLESMSLHSWGIAIDINAAENPLGSKPVMSRDFVRCFTDAGFDWGGTWKRMDGMHFELSGL